MSDIGRNATGLAAPPPSLGPPNGFGDPATLPQDSKANVIVGVASFCLILGTTAVTLRLYTRYFMVGHVGVDDYMSILSLIFLYGVGISQFINVGTGLGTHIYLLDLPAAIIPYTRDFYFGLLFYNITLFFIKMTFLFQYYRIVVTVKKFRMVYIVSIVVIGAWTLSQILIILFFCVPIPKFWDRSIPGKCFESGAEQDMNAIGNIVTDFIILLLPLPVLLRLTLKPAQKWALIGVFCVGFFTCGVSIIRRVLGLRFDADITYSSVDVTSWSIAEITSGITCAALPTLKPFLSRYIPMLRSRVMRYTGYKKTTDETDKSFGTRSRQVSMSKPAAYVQGRDVEANTWRDGDNSLEMDSRNERRVEIRPAGGPLNSNTPVLERNPHSRFPSVDNTWPLSSKQGRGHSKSPSVDNTRSLPLSQFRISKQQQTGHSRSLSVETSRISSQYQRPFTEWPMPSNTNTTIVGGDDARSKRDSNASSTYSVSKPPAIRVKRSVKIETVHEDASPSSSQPRDSIV